MDGDTASKFVASLVKSIQALCNGYIDFATSVEVIGHIHLRIDQNQKLDYVLSEEVNKSQNEAATVFSSHSYHSQHPPSATPNRPTPSASPGHHRRKTQQVPRKDENDGMTLSAVPDVPSFSKDMTKFSERLQSTTSRQSDSSDSTRSFTASENDTSRNMKKQDNASSRQSTTHDSLDRRRKLLPEAHHSHGSTSKRGRPSGGSAPQDSGFEVIEIKEEPTDEESSSYLDNGATGQDISQPDFSNLVADSLDRVGQLEGVSLLTTGDGPQMQMQPLRCQQDQPFPVMLHANATASTSSSAPLPGPSDQGASASGGEDEVVKTRRIKITVPFSGGEGNAAGKKGRLKRAKGGYRMASCSSVANKGSKVLPKVSKVSAKISKINKEGLATQEMPSSVFVSSYREYTSDDVAEAIELVHGGMPVIDAALRFGIPRATLFIRSRQGCPSHTGRCSTVFARANQEAAAFARRNRPKHKYKKEAIEEAIDVVHAGVPVIDAALQFGIPRATLFARSGKGCPTHEGRCSTVFTDGQLRRTTKKKFEIVYE